MEALTINQNGTDGSTGLVIKGTFNAGSGFNYQTGFRQFGDLKIVEGVSKGTACIFLTSLFVYDQNGSLIFDGEIQKWTNYSRETVRRLVLNGMLLMLREAAKKNNKVFDDKEAYEIIDQKLKSAYYEQSYTAVIGWAKNIGIDIS